MFEEKEIPQLFNKKIDEMNEEECINFCNTICSIEICDNPECVVFERMETIYSKVHPPETKIVFENITTKKADELIYNHSVLNNLSFKDISFSFFDEVVNGINHTCKLFYYKENKHIATFSNERLVIF